MGGSLLHDERAKAIFFGGGCNNHPFEFQRQRFGFSFSIFRLNIFECAVAVVCGVGLFKNEYNTMESVHNSFTQ